MQLGYVITVLIMFLIGMLANALNSKKESAPKAVSVMIGFGMIVWSIFQIQSLLN